MTPVFPRFWFGILGKRRGGPPGGNGGEGAGLEHFCVLVRPNYVCIGKLFMHI